MSARSQTSGKRGRRTHDDDDDDDDAAAGSKFLEAGFRVERAAVCAVASGGGVGSLRAPRMLILGVSEDFFEIVLIS